MGHQCGCGGCQHDEPAEEKNNPPAGGDGCACGHSHSVAGHAISHAEKEKLIEAIKAAGHDAEETADGEIKVIEKE